MSISRQSALGTILFVGGGMMLFAMLQNSDSSDAARQQKSVKQVQQVNQSEVTLTAVTDEELTTDIETEARILEQKQRKREAQVKEQEQKSQAFIEQQEEAATRAIENTREENEQFRNAQKKLTKDDIAHPTVSYRKVEESIDQNINVKENNTTKELKTVGKDSANNAPNQPITYYASHGDGLIKLSKEYNIPLEILAEANNMHILDDLMYGQKLIIPSKAQVAKLEKNAKQKQAMREAQIKAEAEAKRKSEEEKRKKREAAELKAKQKREKEQKEKELLAQKSNKAKRKAEKKLTEARRTVKEENAKGTFGVQVALAADKDSAEKIVEKFRQAGYKVKTSQTSRGVRVIVGPERGKVAALALKDKINSDPKVKTTSAWVLYWR